LLLDEPFGALDRKLREQMQLEVRRLQRRLGLTAVFVTHDQEEALILSDRIAVMESGQIVQLGTPLEIYRRPVNRFVATFIGESNLYRAKVLPDGRAELESGMRLRLPDGAPPAGTDIGLLLRPERPRPAGQAAMQDADAALSGAVSEVVYLGDTVKYRIQGDAGTDLVVRWPFHGHEQPHAVGERVSVNWDRRDMHWIHWQ
jgi:ABC-type Fe3+/spermidine/putrescine transport system ATPase subunit